MDRACELDDILCARSVQDDRASPQDGSNAASTPPSAPRPQYAACATEHDAALAAEIGGASAMFVRGQLEGRGPWPPFTGRAAAIALHLVAGLASEPCRSKLARICHRRAGLRWESLVAFALGTDTHKIFNLAIRLQLISIGNIDDASRAGLWKLLAVEEPVDLDRLHFGLHTRIQTLRHLEEIREHIRPISSSYKRVIRKRSIGLLKSAMAFADHTFFSAQRGQEVDSSLSFGSSYVSIYSKEDLPSAFRR